MMESQKAAEDSYKRKKKNIGNLRGFIVLQIQLDFFLSSRKENSLLILTKAESSLLYNTSFIDQSCAVKMARH